MYKIELQWKEFNIDLRAVDAALRELYPNYTGNQAVSSLELWFSEEPSDSEKAELQAYWDDIHEASDEAESYQSVEDIEIERLAKKASGKAKLIALGLTEEEADAMIGK